MRQKFYCRAGGGGGGTSGGRSTNERSAISSSTIALAREYLSLDIYKLSFQRVLAYNVSEPRHHFFLKKILKKNQMKCLLPFH